MTIPFIDLKSQYQALRPQIQSRIDAVFEHGQYIMGPEVKELEDKLAAFTGAKHCITCASGTEALLMSLMALGIGPGDEIVTTPFTFVATAEVIVLLGLYGQTADMDVINAIAAKYGDLPVIEDAAQSFGATYKGRQSCNLSTIGCTSFFPSKPLGCYGDGGAIFTNDDALAQAMREIRVHGQSQRYVHTRVGVGGRMDTLQCAIVLAKLERFEWEVQQRMEIGRHYTDMIMSLRERRSNVYPEDIRPPTIRPDRTSVFAQYTIMVPQREALQKRLAEAGIPTAVHYPVPLNEQPAYKHLCCPDCTPVAQQLAKKVMSLPMGADLDANTQHSIIERLFLD
jgi:UDP-2-acetamido-2-deoxy-ribo-hexuluronate aminotransferase